MRDHASSLAMCFGHLPQARQRDAIQARRIASRAASASSMSRSSALTCRRQALRFTYALRVSGEIAPPPANLHDRSQEAHTDEIAISASIRSSRVSPEWSLAIMGGPMSLARRPSIFLAHFATDFGRSAFTSSRSTTTFPQSASLTRSQGDIRRPENAFRQAGKTTYRGGLGTQVGVERFGSINRPHDHRHQHGGLRSFRARREGQEQDCEAA